MVKVHSCLVILEEDDARQYFFNREVSFAGSRMSISSRRSSVSSIASRLKGGGRMGRAKDQTKETASQQHAAKLVTNTRCT